MWAGIPILISIRQDVRSSEIDLAVVLCAAGPHPVAILVGWLQKILTIHRLTKMAGELVIQMDIIQGVVKKEGMSEDSLQMQLQPRFVADRDLFLAYSRTGFVIKIHTI